MVADDRLQALRAAPAAIRRCHRRLTVLTTGSAAFVLAGLARSLARMVSRAAAVVNLAEST
jgi:hypothetical protein